MITKKWIALVLISFSARSFAEGLIPMPQYFEGDTNETIQGAFQVSSNNVTVYVSGADVSNVIITTPTGQSVNSSNAGSFGFTWETSQMPFTIQDVVTINSANAVPGEYQFWVMPSTSQMASFSVVEAPGIQYVSLIANKSKRAEPNQPFAISIAVFFNSAPIQGASVIADVVSTSGIPLSQLNLLDNGQYPDAVANDGLYTGTTTVSSEGEYRVKYSLDWNGRKGAVYDSFLVQNPKVSLTNVYTVEEADTDSDGFTDELIFIFEENLPRISSDYSATVDIRDINGQLVRHTDLTRDPSLPISVTIPVEKFIDMAPPPWQLESINIWHEADPLGIWKIKSDFTVDVSLFSRDGMIVSGVSSDTGIDTDGDGYFEALNVIVNVDTLAGGYYGFSTDIRGPNNELIGSTSNSQFYLPSGTGQVTLNFLGSDIGGAGINGKRSTNPI